jgi:hypothetical protein
VAAVVADSAFDSIEDFIRLRLREDLGLRNRAFGTGCLAMFRLYRMVYPAAPYENFSPNALADRSLLMIQGGNRLELAACTAEIYGRIQARKQLIILPVARTRNMNGEEMKSYDRQVVEFFRGSMPGK